MKYIFVDYEGTLTEALKSEVTVSDLLFGDVFTDLQPNKIVKDFLLKQNVEQIYVLGVVDTGHEIKQKEQWLKRYYPMIPETNYIFISGEHQKVEILDAFVRQNGWKKNDVFFIDDRVKHLKPATEAGYHCLNANELA